MHLRFLLIITSILCINFDILSNEILKVKLWDGEETEIRLSLPESTNTPNYLVLFIHGTGPNTYLNKRGKGEKQFNYYDLFADEFNKRGVGFVSYNRRGVSIGNNPPLYDEVDSVKFLKYLPLTETKDIESIIGYLKTRKALNKTKIILLGWSEGTIIATMIAERKKVDISALLLCGYANENMFDIIKWQLSGASSMVKVCSCFDRDNNKEINRKEYESSESIASKCREKLFANADFSIFDKNQDSIINKQDFGLQLNDYYNVLINMIKQGKNDWLWKNYFQITSQWVKAHYQLEANKTRMTRLGLPIFIFHGDEDLNTPLEGVYDIQEKFDILGKDNLSCNIFEKHDHDLNYLECIKNKKIPEGIEAIFESVNKLK